MIVFVDTNVLFSSFYNSNSIPGKAIIKVSEYPYSLFTSDYCLSELYSVVNKKKPNLLGVFASNLFFLLPQLNIVHVNSNKTEILIRDKNDVPVIEAALLIDADILITGDKDLLEFKIDKPKIITTRDFIDNY